MGGRLGRAGWLVALLLGGACSSTPEESLVPASERSGGVVHILRAGENVYRLSRFYGVPVEAIVRANRFDDLTALRVGQEIWVPGTAKGSATDPLTTQNKRSETDRIKSAMAASLELGWPVRGKLSSRFGWRNGRRHDGIDIPARRGTPVHAAQAGRVIHSGGGLGDYGKVVIVKHSGRFSTVYAHNDRIRVRKGQFIEKGDVLGEVGTSGNASGPHVHFEVRRDRKPLDPLLYLP
jgi:murein DD-endopeptidase MepM/ murein hydrolase activator NlpD